MVYNGEKKKGLYLTSTNNSSSLFYAVKGGNYILKENAFQAGLIKEIKNRLPGCIVLKNDSSYMQGVPDLLILHNDRWATLEVKKSEKASHRPNQEYYVEKMNDMSFSAFIFPENMEDVLNDLERSLQRHP